MKISINRAVKAVVLFIALVLFDLFTKSAAVNALSDGRRIPLIPGALEFYYIQKRGAAFGMFQNGTFILSRLSMTALIVLENRAALYISRSCGQSVRQAHAEVCQGLHLFLADRFSCIQCR